jgi:hypothetical protein
VRDRRRRIDDRRRLTRAVAVALLAAIVALVAAFAGGKRPLPQPDAGTWLQRRLDQSGGRIFLPRLAGGRCYRSHGLWVSHSDTTIVSNGACLDVVAAGPVRLRSADGDPIAASAAFFISRSRANARSPAHVRIAGLQIHVAAGGIDGIDVYARDVRISDVRIDGEPFDDVYIGGRTNLIDFSREVSVTGSTLLNAARNVISVTAAVDVRIRGDTLAGAGSELGPAADPGDGIDVEPNAVTDPIVNVRIAENRIVGNEYQAVALRLRPHGRPCLHASGIRVVDNLIAGNQPFGGGAQITLSDRPPDAGVLIAGNGPRIAIPQRFESSGVRRSNDLNRVGRRRRTGRAPGRARDDG